MSSVGKQCLSVAFLNPLGWGKSKKVEIQIIKLLFIDGRDGFHGTSNDFKN
jgi:hypothetical protein